MNDLSRQQLSKEEKIILSYKRCNSKHVISDIEDNVERLQSYSSHKKFYDFDFLSSLFCMFDTVLHYPIDKKSKLLKELYTDLREIGNVTGSSTAILSSLGNAKNNFIIKRTDSYEELFHEYFVAVNCLNCLRRIVPNFVYIFGFYQCLSSLSKTCGDYCGNYLIQEKLEGNSLHDELITCKIDEFCSWYFQVLFALETAYEHCDFTHYDLDTTNIILRKWISEDTQEKDAHKEQSLPEYLIMYRDKMGRKLYVKTNKVATIIDFTKSHVKYRGGDFGKYGMEDQGIYAERSRPLFDAYRLLAFSLYVMKVHHNKTYFEALKLFQVFVPNGENQTVDDFDEYIKTGQENQFTIFRESHEHFNGMDISDLLEYYKEKCSHLWNKTVFTRAVEGMKILGCEDLCMSEEQAEKLLAERDTKNEIRYALERDDHLGDYGREKIFENIIRLRDELSHDLKKIEKKLDRTNDLPIESIPKTVDDSDIFRNIIEEFVEPNIEVREKIMKYMNDRSLLERYYEKFKEVRSLEEFSLSESFSLWQKRYKIIYTKIKNMFIPPEFRNMREEILNLMQN